MASRGAEKVIAEFAKRHPKQFAQLATEYLDLDTLNAMTDAELYRIPGIGRKSLPKVREFIAEAITARKVEEDRTAAYRARIERGDGLYRHD